MLDDNGREIQAMVTELFKWEGPLDARKIVERMVAAMLAGVFMGIGFYACGALFG